MNEGDVFLTCVLIAHVVLFFGMLYGDYLDGEYTPFWQKKKDGVNSGAKFG